MDRAYLSSDELVLITETLHAKARGILHTRKSSDEQRQEACLLQELADRVGGVSLYSAPKCGAMLKADRG